MKTKPLKICFDRVIPHDQAVAFHAARSARIDDALNEIGAATPRSAMADINPDTEVIGAPRMALINSRKWQNGMTVRCRFLQGSKKQKAKVIEHAESWMEYANLKFRFVDTGDAELRIAFISGDGSWSAVGTDALIESYFPKHQPTMNFGWLEDNTGTAEARRVVMHEFGHAIGCIHEHQSPNETLNWNTEAVYRYFSGSPNFWTKAQIDHNVLRKYSANGTTATIFDPASIMLYQFAAELFTDGEATPNNTKLSALDKKMIAEMYPKISAAAAPRRSAVRSHMAAVAADAGAGVANADRPSRTRANELVRNAIRQAVFAVSLSADDYVRMTIANIRQALTNALAPEIDTESARLNILNNSIRRRFRQAGWTVQPPAVTWYAEAARQTAKAPTIADHILANPITSSHS
jgi:hypothetical protein